MKASTVKKNPLFIAFGDGTSEEGLDFNFDFKVDDTLPTTEEGDVIPEPKKKKDDEKPVKTKEDSIKDLRAQRDEARQRIKELELKAKEADSLKSLKPLNKVAEYIASKTGKQPNEIKEEDVDKFIEKNKLRKKELGELAEKFNQKDAELKDLNIERSEEWEREYQVPLRKSATALAVSLDQVDSKGKSLHPDFTQALLQQLGTCLSEDGIVNYGKVKAVLKSANEKYKISYDDDPDMPSVNEVVKLMEDYHEKVIKANDAKKNWQAEMKKRQDHKTFEEAKNLELRTKRERDAFNFVKNKLKTDFDSSQWDIDEEEFNNAVDQHVENRMSIMEGKKKPMSPTEFISRNIKADRYDLILEENKKLKAKLKLSRGASGDHDKFSSSSISDDDDENLGTKFSFED
jgi:hypothetical protein